MKIPWKTRSIVFILALTGLIAGCSSMGMSGGMSGLSNGVYGASGMEDMHRGHSQRVFDPNDPYHGG